MRVAWFVRSVVAAGVLLVAGTTTGLAQTAAPASPPAAASAVAASPIEGIWQGTLIVNPQQKVRTVLRIHVDGSTVHATFQGVDQGPPLAVDDTRWTRGPLTVKVQQLGATYTATLSADGRTLTGTWSQGGGSPLPLELAKTAPEDVWQAPPPPKPMDAKADPGFDVATIKPTSPTEQGRMFTLRGHDIITVNTSLADIMSFAFDVQKRQLINLPPWATSEHYDIVGKPDTDGMPNDRQYKGMLRKLLVERFALKDHPEQRKMSAMVLTREPGDVKMKQSDSRGNLPGLFFQGLGDLHVMNATMADFTHLLQAVVLDSPVVDHTGLTNRYDFTLKWAPDESEFPDAPGAMRNAAGTAGNASNLPSLYTALQEQLGLKLGAQQTDVPVIVIDSVQRPSPN